MSQFNQDDVRHRFAHHSPDSIKARSHATVRALLVDVALDLNDLVPDSREKALMMTHLEDAMMWGNAGIARN